MCRGAAPGKRRDRAISEGGGRGKRDWLKNDEMSSVTDLKLWHWCLDLSGASLTPLFSVIREQGTGGLPRCFGIGVCLAFLRDVIRSLGIITYPTVILCHQKYPHCFTGKALADYLVKHHCPSRAEALLVGYLLVMLGVRRRAAQNPGVHCGPMQR